MISVELWDASGGWPGIVDRLALLALAKAEYCPVSAASIERPTVPGSTQEAVVENDVETEVTPADAPVLYLTKNGRTIKKIVLESARLLVGRSDHNDLAIGGDPNGRMLLIVRGVGVDLKLATH